MGKSLVIKGADFSANGIPVEVIIGTLTKTNPTTGLNVSFSKTDIQALSPSGNSIKVLLGTDDQSVNTSMQGKNVSYIKSSNPYTEYGTKKWGTPVTISIANMSSSIVCQSSGNPYFENVEVWLKVIEG